MNKDCARCRLAKPIDAFHKQGKRHHSWCKECFNEYARETRNRKVTPHQRSKNNIWTRYRLRPEDVAQLLAEQDGVCAICGHEPKRPVIDHDHETGAVRGILCHPCNIKLPAIEDASFTAAALAYLRRGK